MASSREKEPSELCKEPQRANGIQEIVTKGTRLRSTRRRSVTDLNMPGWHIFRISSTAGPLPSRGTIASTAQAGRVKQRESLSEESVFYAFFSSTGARRLIRLLGSRAAGAASSTATSSQMSWSSAGWRRLRWPLGACAAGATGSPATFAAGGLSCGQGNAKGGRL